MTKQVTLPKFSDKKDIDEFVEKLEAFERGDINADEFRAFRLLRGVYGQRQTDVQMFRIKVPMGLLGPEQLVAIADVADRYSRGFGHITTRQNIQLHFMKLGDAEATMRRLDEAGLTSREACGNSVRNVTACELAEVCKDAPFDVTPYAEASFASSSATRSRAACRGSSRLRSAAAPATAPSAPSTTSASSRRSRGRAGLQGLRRRRALDDAPGRPHAPRVRPRGEIGQGGRGARPPLPRARKPRKQAPRPHEVRAPEARRAGIPRQVR